MVFALLGFGLAWDLIALFFLLISPFWNGNVYPRPVPLLYYGSTSLIWFLRFTGGEEFCFRVSHTYSLTHLIRYADTLDIYEVDTGELRLLGDIGME